MAMYLGATHRPRALDHGRDVGGVVPLARDEEVERLEEFDGQAVAGKFAQKGDDRVALAHFAQLGGMNFTSLM